jgi:hypothetical protein
MDVRIAADLLIGKIEKDYKDDIALVVMMGSHLYNDTHPMSDLDMYFIPKTDRGYRLGSVFIIQGIGFDFWPISWERIGRIAGREERITSIVTEGRVLWHGTEDDLERFEKLKKESLEGLKDDERLKKSKERLASAKTAYHPFHSALSLTQARRHALDVLGDLTECLALFNNVTIRRGRGKIPGEIKAMPRVPDGFLERYDTVFLSRSPAEIGTALFGLIDTTGLLVESDDSLKDPAQFKVVANGFYEEFVNMYNKIGRAHQTGDFRTALHVAREMEIELGWLFHDSGETIPDFPDLVGLYDPDDLGKLAGAAKTHQSVFETFLASKGVTIRTFPDFGALEAYLETL